MPPIVNVDNIWELLLALIIALAWGTREVLQRSARPENGVVSENKVQTMIDKHALECPGVERLEREIRALRGSIDNLTQYLLNRRDS